VSDAFCPECRENLNEPPLQKARSAGAQHPEPEARVKEGQDMMNESARIVGIGGWLILPAIGLVISPVLGVIGLAVSLATLKARYAEYSIPSLIVNAALVVWLCVISVQFFKKKRSLPRNIIQFMIWRSVASLLLFMLGILVVGSTDELFLLRLLRANNFIAQGIAAAIWIPYFMLSKRVRATFVN
jgi:hypothetical protein